MSITAAEQEMRLVWEELNYQIPIEDYDRTRMQRKLVETWDGSRKWVMGCCRVCADMIEGTVEPIMIGGQEAVAGVCEKCVPIVDEHYEQLQGEAKESEDTPEWRENCPLLYQDIINSPDMSIDGINWLSYREVENWSYGKKGMYISGESGKGKTTAIWALYRKFERDTGKPPKVVKAVKLAKLLAMSARDLDNDQITWLSRYKVLIIDDLGKEKITATFAAQLFEVINARYEQFKPTIITTKFQGEGLKQRFSQMGEDSTGNDIIRRLGQTCDKVRF